MTCYGRRKRSPSDTEARDGNYYGLNDNPQALQFCQQALAITSDLGIPLKTECETLLRELNGEE